MSKFFINRPIFAWVIAILVMLSGVFAVYTLPVAQYPTIALPQVGISASYPGASAETLSNIVTQVIEQHMNGIDNLAYMSSTSESSGSASITLTFEAGTDPDIAQVQVQNKLQLAMPSLPEIVQRLGVSVKKTNASFLIVVGFVSQDRSMNSTEISDYIVSSLQDDISRLQGVGDFNVFGSQHSMRIWVDPDKLSNYNLTLSDISAVLESQNLQVSAGQLGDMPQTRDQQLNATVSAQTLLETPEQFRDILVRVNRDGSVLKLGDVADVEVGQESYAMQTVYNGQPASGISISLASDANALQTATLLRQYLDGAKEFFPPGLAVVYPYDTTPFIRISIHEVIKTLIEAIILVFLVMYIFLQNFRATLVPAIAVPVVLLGTFGILSVAGFSINTLTMFGMVLAIGLLVDDAIVVVENVERVMAEEGLSPKAAAEKSMEQISGALIGVAMVLSAVFVPMAFSSGSVGAIFRQFSITLVSAMGLSVMVALVLTPALCATLLKHEKPVAIDQQKGPFGWFNRFFQKNVDRYGKAVGGILSRSTRFLLIYLVIGVGMIAMFPLIPTSFLPDEDQGIMMIEAQLPAGATTGRTQAVMEQVEQYLLDHEKEAVDSIMYVVGYSFSGSGQNSAMAFVRLKDWALRTRPELGVKAVAARAAAKFAEIHDAAIYPIIPPAVSELGHSSGFDLQLIDRGKIGHEALMAARDQFLALAASDKYNNRIINARPNGKSDTPEYRIDVDLAKAYAFEVAINDIHDMLQTGWGGGYVNDYLDQGRLKKVYMQAKPEARMLPEDFDKWYIRNREGKMVPFGALVRKNWVYGSPRLERYNGLPSVEITGQAPPDLSTGQAMTAAEEIVKELPSGVGLFWTGLSLQERQAGSQSTFLYAVSLLVVFLCLAALYESWAIPFAVMLVMPLGVIGVQAAALLFDQANDVYFQVGFLTIIGLSAKNAILIVEFAKSLHEEQGVPMAEAALKASLLRIRPILMTSLAFILGVLPLAISKGAGSGGQNAIGIGVIGGMLTATILGVFFIPLFYTVVGLLGKRLRKEKKAEA